MKNFMVLCGAMLAMGAVDQSAVEAAQMPYPAWAAALGNSFAAGGWYGASAYRSPVAQALPARYAAGVSNFNCANGRCSSGACFAAGCAGGTGYCPNGQCGQTGGYGSAGSGYYGSNYSRPYLRNSYPANWTSRNDWGSAARYPSANYSQSSPNRYTARRPYDAYRNNSRSLTSSGRPLQPIYNTNLSNPFFN